MQKIFITRKLAGNAEKFLKENGYSVKVFQKDRSISNDEFIKNAKDANAVITLVTDKIDKNIIDSLPDCKIIANCAVGYNNIDVDYARSKNITVTNTPGILTEATADLTVGLILACARRFGEGERMMRAGKFKSWKPQLLLGKDLSGKTIGIVGAGRIGYAAAKRLKAFGTKIIYFDRNRRENFETELNAKKVSLKFLFKNADIISLHLPLSKDSFNIIDKTKLILMKKSGIIVNTSRGEIIDEKFLISMLKSKKIFAAGFDVYEGEPLINPDLLKMENVFLLPHIGSATLETRSGMAMLCAKNVAAVLGGRKPLNPV